MDSSCHLVSLDVHEDDSTVINIRVRDNWVHAELNLKGLENEKLKEQYLALVAKHRLEEADTEDGKASDPTADSGYASDNEKPKSGPLSGADATDKQTLQEWILGALDTVCRDISSTKKSRKQRSLETWYRTCCHCFEIKGDSKNSQQLTVVSRDDLDGDAYVETSLTPGIDIPKYIQNQKAVPWYSPADLTVEDEADDIHLSIHPTLVSVATNVVPEEMQKISSAQKDKTSPTASSKPTSTERTTYFLKLAQSHDPKSVKHEITFLQKLDKLDLYNKGLRAPRLAGLVHPPNASPKSQNPPKRLLGFLLTLIPQPTTPLTHFMDVSVPSAERSDYATQAQEMVDVLHDHNLVWGDAKADNFLVDGKGILWMIDFGGSFTPGWIDEELADTKEGDDAGTEKIVRGLEDPERWTEDVAGEGHVCQGTNDEDKNPDQANNKKRARSVSEDEEKESLSQKRKTGDT